MDLDAITFGLAGAGYILLAKDTALRILGRRWPLVGTLTALVVTAHVLLVWGHRFGWDVRVAWEKSPAGFLIFHAAFLLIVVALLVKGIWRDRTVFGAFLIVSAGALPAPFRYEEVAVLGVPLFVAAGAVVAVFVSKLARSCTARA